MAKRKAKSTPAPTSTPAPLSTPAPRSFAALVAVALAALALLPAPPGHAFVPLYDAGRVLAALGLVLALVHRLRPHAITRALAPWSLALIVLGLGALLGRHTWDFRAFAEVHQADFGFPSELAWVALAVGLRRAHARVNASDPIAFGAIAFGLGWGLVALVIPEPTIADTATALGTSFTSPTTSPLRALLAITLLASLALALATVIAALRKRALPFAEPFAVSPSAAVAGFARAPALLLATALAPAVALALSGLTSETPLHAIAVAMLLTTITLVSESVLSDRETHPSPTRDRIFLGGTLAVIALVWLLLKSQALVPSNTDENIYFYMAKILGDGKWPYADYFFAHPPLHVVLPGAAFAVFGYSLTFAKLFPMLATLIGGFAVWGIARRAFSPFAAPLAFILYLFGAEVLKASSNMTGVNMTAMWLLLGTWQSMKGHPIRAGALLGAAVTTGFYSMAPALAVIALGFFWQPLPVDTATPSTPVRRRPGLRNGLGLLAGFVIVAGLINMIFFGIGGDTFREGVYAYHQAKAFENLDMVELFGGNPGFPASLFRNIGALVASSDFVKEIFYHPHLWLAGLTLPVVVLARWLSAHTTVRQPLYRIAFPSTFFRTGPEGRALVIWLIALALFVQYALFRELYSFYFGLIYPFLALAAAYTIWRGLTLLVPLASTHNSRTTSPARPLIAAALGLGAVLALGLHGVVSYKNQVVFDDELEQVGGRNDYTWTEPPVLSSLSGITKLLFWSSDRLKPAIEPGYRHYLWTKKRTFSVLDEVADYIRANSTEDESLAGGSTLAPLLALMSDRHIAGYEIDTNSKRFQAKLITEAVYWQRVCDDHVRFLVAVPRTYFTSDKLDNMPLVARAFTKDKTFMDPTLQYNAPFPIVLYRRIDGAPCGP